MSFRQAPVIKVRYGFFFLFLNQNMCFGTQKNRLHETVLLSTKHMFKFTDKKIMIVLCQTIA